MSDLTRADHETVESQETVSQLSSEYASFWSAPLPRPEVLAQYNDAFPGCAERIVAMTEEQSRHRHEIESAVIHADVYSQKTGLWLAFVLASAVIACGAWLVYTGKTEWGAGFVTIPLILLVSIFVTGKRYQRKQLQQVEPVDPQQNLPFPS